MNGRIIDVTRRGSYAEHHKAYLDAMRAMKEEARENAIRNGKEVDADEEDNK